MIVIQEVPYRTYLVVVEEIMLVICLSPAPTSAILDCFYLVHLETRMKSLQTPLNIKQLFKKEL